MNNGSIKKLALVLLIAALIAGMYACSQKKSLVKWHPVEVTAAPNCADCHKDNRAALNHTPDFATRHKFYAMQRKEVCDLCHVESFCTDCHAHKEEIKPSDKFKDSPERSLPHRGDYLTQHRIDGRINPASCFPCHGRMNNERCKVCHK